MRQNALLPLSCLSVLLLLVPHPAAASPKKLQVARERSYIVAITHKAGLLRFVGHEHGILVTAWSADVNYDEANPAASRIALTIPTRALVIDSAEARSKAGLKQQGPSAEDVQKLQRKMLSDKGFDAQKYPEMTFTTTAIEPQAAGQWVLQGLLTMRGMSHQVTIPVTISRQQEMLNVVGRFSIHQTMYGIKPESIAGVVKVADEVEIRFDIWARPEA